MLEIMIVMLPAALGFLAYYRQHGPKFRGGVTYSLFYVVSINALILIGLKSIGMHSFHLSEMSTRFKMKWILLEIVLSAVFARTDRNICRLNLSVLRRIIKRFFPAVLFFIVTYVVFTPSSLFLENINEFSISYVKILPVIVCVTLFFVLFLYLSVICLASEKMLHLCIALLFGMALCLYVQGNFLNPALPSLNGTEINWASYQRENIISICFWALCMVLSLVMACVWKEKTEKVMRYAAYFLSAIQMVTLVVLLFLGRTDNHVNYGFAKEGEFVVGAETNIIIFLVDTLQASAMEEYLTSDAYDDQCLDDFTFFDNAVSGGASTRAALPLLLTGIEYDPMQPMEAYTKEIWEETMLYRDLHDNGWDVRFYTTARYCTPPAGIADNYMVTGDSWIYDYPVFGSQLYKLVNFYLMPQFLKPYFWLTENTILGTISSAEGGYICDDVQFYQDFKAAGGLRTEYDKSFRLYHLEGVHKPYLMNENAERLEEGKSSVTERQILQGNMKIITEYMDAMKEAGVYENSAIVILGDHGRHEDGNIEANPAVLLKLPHESHELCYNSAPVHFRNLFATMAGIVVEDYSPYGPSLYDITKESDPERLHTAQRSIVLSIPMEEPAGGFQDYTRFIIHGEADSGTYSYFDSYEINRILYRRGDRIDFTTDNELAEQICYRLYKENNTAIASNELSMCFVLEDFEEGDIEFHFTYADLYSDAQKIRIYANGNKVSDMLCTREETGEDMAVTISKDMISEDTLVLRLVFPNAVTPNQLDRDNADVRVLSVAFETMWLE